MLAACDKPDFEFRKIDFQGARILRFLRGTSNSKKRPVAEKRLPPKVGIIATCADFGYVATGSGAEGIKLPPLHVPILEGDISTLRQAAFAQMRAQVRVAH